MTPEDAFRIAYVTTGEIQRRVNVSGAAISQAVKVGNFPKPMELDERMHIWPRETVEQKIKDWAAALASRRNK